MDGNFVFVDYRCHIISLCYLIYNIFHFLHLFYIFEMRPREAWPENSSIYIYICIHIIRCSLQNVDEMYIYIYRYINTYTYISIDRSIHPSIDTSIYLPIDISIDRPIYRCGRQFIDAAIYL